MILPNCRIAAWAHDVSKTSGIDSLEHCRNREHFIAFPYDIEYRNNSRGFRDEEWPDSIEELKSSIWCVGDSFTSGVGSPYDQMWPRLLSQKLSKRCINVSMDGASNDWIARKVKEIINEVEPEVMCVHWSYINRYEDEDTSLSDELRRKPYLKLDTVDLIQRFINFVIDVEDNRKSTRILHSIVPKSGYLNDEILNDEWICVAGADWPTTAPLNNITELTSLPKFVIKELKSMQVYDKFIDLYQARHCENFNKVSDLVHAVSRIDFARDYQHYGIASASKFAEELAKEIKQ